MFRFRDGRLAEAVADKIKAFNMKVRIMHVCGTQQDTIVRFGLDQIFAEAGVDMRQGPGCPICITPPAEFEEAIALAKNGKIVAVYGDALKVPALSGSLADARAEGCDVRVVYSIEDAVKIAEQTDRDVVFMAIGFETTAPSTAIVLLNKPPENFSILNCHRYVPPALFALLDLGEIKLHGLIEPGHVSTIIGCKPYEEISRRYHIPQVVSGFEPLDMLVSVYMILRQISSCLLYTSPSPRD